MRVHALFRDVFGESRPFDTWLIDLENEFANMVNERLFPVEIEAMNMYLEADEDPFNAPIPISGWRIPWDVCDTSELDNYQVPVAELLTEANEGPVWDPDEGVPMGGPAWLRMDAPDAVVEANLARIAALPGLLCGLADLVRLALGVGLQRGNPFLDLPGVMVAYEYMDWDTPWYWDKDDIGKLAKLYEQARPIVERIEAFHEWFDANPGEADGAVLHAIWGDNLLVNMPELVGPAGEIADA